MKILTKRTGRLKSVRQTLIEQTRMRNSFERRLYSQLLNFFAETGKQASEEVVDGNVRLVNLDNRLGQILLPHYRAIITMMANRFVFAKEETDFERFVSLENCLCTEEDYECDYGFERVSGNTC